MEICSGERPSLENIPQLLSELIKLCWDADPSNRPAAKSISHIIAIWITLLDNNNLAEPIMQFTEKNNSDILRLYSQHLHELDREAMNNDFGCKVENAKDKDSAFK
ncbi:11581_t:CDS:2 [Acaulospora morrowiae]|uniref:11581_t:CDS:1 n=1 Tax=Acaulospora morrowiae TaxID=94023 RepID=A0A9N9AC12_9GLOM|nr:11581_t:CDS:2 [Acaulospora morrowiae]